MQERFFLRKNYPVEKGYDHGMKRKWPLAGAFQSFVVIYGDRADLVL